MELFFRRFKHFDFLLVLAVAMLVLFGILMIASATRDVASLAGRTSSQITYAIVGIFIVLIFAVIDYHFFTSIYLWIYALIVLILAIVGILGTEGEAGAQSWLDFGIAGFQPSELAKVLLVVVLAKQMSEASDRIGDLKTILFSLIFVGIPVFFIFIQPDLGITMLILVTWFAMVWGAGIRLSHVGLFALVGAIAAPVLWGQMEDYQKSRITVFINPESDPAGFFNIDQAMIAIGNGGLLGRGYMQGSQSQLRFLRVRHTDYIFAVIGEEFGFVGALFVIFLMGFVIYRILRAARLASDLEGTLICYGIGMIIFFQTIVSIGMNLQMMPVTGLTLPFVSSGGSSLVTLLMGIGLVESVLMRSSPRDL